MEEGAVWNTPVLLERVINHYCILKGADYKIYNFQRTNSLKFMYEKITANYCELKPGIR
jgi:hypothetical protein